MRPADDRDDRHLLRAHVEGDTDAFGTLFARHRDRLWAVALRTTGDPEEAADALQDALIAAFRRAGSYRGDAAVTTWLHRIVVNACLDRLRRRRVRMAEPLPDDAALEPGRRRTGSASPRPLTVDSGVDPGATVVDPADLALDHERRAAVLAALQTLPLDQRAALVLVDMEGYSVEETAAILRVRARHREEPVLAGQGQAAATADRASAGRATGRGCGEPTGAPARRINRPHDRTGGDQR